MNENQFEKSMQTIKNYIDATANVGASGDINLDNYALKTDIPTNVSQLENDAGYLTEHQDLSDYAKKDTLTTVTVSSNAVTLTTDKYQYTTITGDTTITLPSTTFAEIHLFFDLGSSFAGTITLSSTEQIRYQAELSFEAGNGYEVILTKVSAMGWLIGAVKYIGEQSGGSVGGGTNPPEVVEM